MSLAMSVAARERFLADVHVGVLSIAAGDERGPLAVPVWYSYRSGGPLSVITSRHSRKAQAARVAKPGQPVRPGRERAVPVRQRRGAGRDRGNRSP